MVISQWLIYDEKQHMTYQRIGTNRGLLSSFMLDIDMRQVAIGGRVGRGIYMLHIRLSFERARATGD